MSQSIFSFRADVAGKTYYVRAYGDTEDQAKDEATWILNRETGVSIAEIKNVERLRYTPDD